MFSLISSCSSWLARYLMCSSLKSSSCRREQLIAICSSHRISDFSSVPCSTNSSWIASKFTLTLPKNYSWKDHHNNWSNSSISKPLCFARAEGQETNIQVHYKSGQKNIEELKVSKCLSPVRLNPKSHKSLYSDSIPSSLNSYNQAQAYIFLHPLIHYTCPLANFRHYLSFSDDISMDYYAAKLSTSSVHGLSRGYCPTVNLFLQPLRNWEYQ